jgi:hypothetical protein
MNKTELNNAIANLKSNPWTKVGYGINYLSPRKTTANETVVDEDGNQLTHSVTKIRHIYTIENPSEVVKALHSAWVKQVGAKTDCIENGKLLFFMPSADFDIRFDQGYVCFNDNEEIIFAVDRDDQLMDTALMDSVSGAEREVIAREFANEKLAKLREIKAQRRANKLKAQTVVSKTVTTESEEQAKLDD